jgi:5'-nucleotidase
VKSVKTFFLILSLLVLVAEGLYAQDVTVIFSGQTHAMLYPCSCPIRQDGGISRRATLIKELRKKHPGLLLLDCGNFTGGGQLDEYTQNIHLDMQRSEVNYKAMELMQYDAVGVGSDEFNFGKEFFLEHAKKSQPAYLSANLYSDKVLAYIIKDCNGVKVAVIGLTGVSVNQKTEGLKISQPDEKINQLVASLKSQGAQAVILLSTLGEKEDLKLVSKVKGIDLVLVGYLPLKEEALTKVDETFFLRPSWQGRQLGKITLKIKDGKLADCNLEKLILTEKISDDSGIAAILPRCYSDVNCKDQELVGICQDPGALNARCLFVKPNPINLSVISLKDCRTCNLELVLSKLRKQFPGLAVNNLDYSQAQARKMIKDLAISTLPAFIFTKEVEQETGFDNLKDDLRLTNNFYVLKAQASGIAYFLDQEVKPGNFDLFISIFEKDSKLLLTTLREFNPVLHFLTVEKGGGFDAKNGVFEVEEYLRGVCVQKYYPEKFWDYLICRSQNIQSSYWEDCLDGLDTQSVKTCSRGQEGINLLRENNSLNKQLKISSGPSYLLDNHEIFSSRGVPTKEELKQILKLKR